MNNSNIKSFSEIPVVNFSRSRHNLGHTHDLTCNVGEVIPFLCDELLPGDNIEVGLSDLTRLTTLINPIFGDIYTDYYLFFIPFRLLWEHFTEFMGENNSTYWTQPTTYSIPQINAPQGGWQVGTIADYMGCSIGKNYSCSALFFRAYAKVINDWFRDENLNTPCNLPINDDTIDGSNGDDYVLDVVKGGKPFIAPKFHDYFTSAFPEPQKGDPVTIGIGDKAPVVFGPVSPYPNFTPYAVGDNVNVYTDANQGLTLVGDNQPTVFGANNANNIVVDLSSASSITINDLRYSFAIQRMLEQQARTGTRYIEILYSFFGVKSPDSRLQRSEYLGGHRIKLDISTIVQTSESNNTPLGDTAGYSATQRGFDLSNKSITEHGVLLGLMCSRYLHSYSQGMDKMWFRKDKYDFYWPQLANIGEQPIFNKEIYLQGNAEDDEVFGYNEAWADYRYKRNRVSGYLRPEVNNSLKSWVLTDNYNSLPSLGSSWLKEDKSNVDRTIAVSSNLTHQLSHNMNIKYFNTRVMPTHSIPRIVA